MKAIRFNNSLELRVVVVVNFVVARSLGCEENTLTCKMKKCKLIFSKNKIEKIEKVTNKHKVYIHTYIYIDCINNSRINER